jgi:hypothetical protein
MKRYIPFLFVLNFLYSCKSHDAAPDVSAYGAKTTVQRFDKDFFGIDTLQMEAGLNALNAKYPHFFSDYLVKILGVNPSDTMALTAIKSFIRTYNPVYKAAEIIADNNLAVTQKQIEQSLKYLQYYAPGWKPDSPFVITPFIGPMDAFEPFALGDYGDVRTASGVGIALQLHLGSREPLYEDGRQAGIFFDYQVRRFTPEMMAVNCVKNIITDVFPYKEAGNTLAEEMIEKGKRMYLLDKLMPETPDSLKLGYTDEQVKGCFANEALIWNYFVKNDLLFSKETSVNQAYIKDGPKTAELGDGAPGYIGLFTGRQIVRAYLKKHPETTITDLMKLPAKTVFEGAGYKP